MKLARRLAAAAGVLALSSGMAVVAGPAHAATAAKVTITINDKAPGTKVTYGDIYLDANVDGPNSNYFVDSGTLTLQVSYNKGKAWSTVATSTDGFAYGSVNGNGKTLEVRAVYGGGSGYDPNDNTVTFSPASATTGVMKVQRGEAVAKETKHKVCYKVGPTAYKNKPIYHYVRIGKSKKWRRSYTEHTNKKSEICYKIKHTKVKVKHVKYKGPKVKAEKTVYVKSGGMKKSVQITKY